MRNLLSANFARLKKSVLFWLGITAMAGYAVLMLVSWYRTNQILTGLGLDPAMETNHFLFSFTNIIGILMAAFTGLFLGTEYSDGVLRSKLTVGHTRSVIYLSNLFAAVITSFLMCLAYIAVVLVAGIPVCGSVTANPLVLLRTLAEALAMCLAHCALLTLVTMNWGNKALSTVACILIVFVLLVMTSRMYSKLIQPEYYNEVVFDELLQEWVESSTPRPNPYYVREPLRSVYRFFYDVLPTGQGMQLTDTKVEDRPSLLALYSLAVTAVSTGLGLLLFRRKDIK